MKKVALITGVTGQDGSYLAELLLKKGYEVHGIKRRASSFNTDRIDHLYQDPHVSARNFTLHYGDLTDSSNLIRIIQQVQPDEIYNLAAQSHVAVSFEEPEFTANADALGALRVLEAEGILTSHPRSGIQFVKPGLELTRSTYQFRGITHRALALHGQTQLLAKNAQRIQHIHRLMDRAIGRIGHKTQHTGVLNGWLHRDTNVGLTLGVTGTPPCHAPVMHHTRQDGRIHIKWVPMLSRQNHPLTLGDPQAHRPFEPTTDPLSGLFQHGLARVQTDQRLKQVTCLVGLRLLPLRSTGRHLQTQGQRTHQSGQKQ